MQLASQEREGGRKVGGGGGEREREREGGRGGEGGNGTEEIFEEIMAEKLSKPDETYKSTDPRSMNPSHKKHTNTEHKKCT